MTKFAVGTGFLGLLLMFGGLAWLGFVIHPATGLLAVGAGIFVVAGAALLLREVA